MNGESAPKKKFRIWSKEEMKLLSDRYAESVTSELARALGRTSAQVFKKASYMGLRKSAAFKTRMAETLRGKRRPGQFAPGNRPWNKGIPYRSGGRSVEHQFQPGKRPQNWRPIGYERVVQGYLERKVTDTGVTGADFRLVHHLVWEASGRGPVPAGYALVFRDGDARNFALENLELVSREDLMRRNSIHSHGPELARLYQLIGAVNRRIKARRKEMA